MPLNVEDGFRYASRLRGDPAAMNPPGWEVDWADAPWPFKIYEGCATLPLPGVGPPWAPRAVDGDVVLERLGRLLYLSVGCTRVRFRPDGQVLSAPERPVPANRGATLAVRRAVASGGALYPAEIYLCTEATMTTPAGTYHYSPARHELERLSAEAPSARLARSLGIDCAAGQLILLVTDLFWKSFYKYGDFSYRLSAVDVGIVVGRLHRLAAAEFGDASLHLDFVDAVANAVLDLDGKSESVYAAIALRAKDTVRAKRWPGHLIEADHDAALTIPERSQNRKLSRDFGEMHASVVAEGRVLPPCEAAGSSERLAAPAQRVPLPAPRLGALDDLPRAIFARTSNGDLLTGGAIGAVDSATVLSEAARAIARARTAAGCGDLPSPSLYVIAQRIDNVPPGAYRYEESGGSLISIRRGDLGLALLASSNIHNINLDLSAFSVHVMDILDFRLSRRGNRTYRIQQMLVGAALDAVMITCGALGLGCHPMLGFNAAGVDSLYDLKGTPLGALAQICVGVARPGHHLEGSIGPWL